MLTRRSLLASSFAAIALSRAPWLHAQATPAQTLQFRGTEYFYRWSNGRLFEFTPKGQEDLDKWTDMISILVLPGVNSPEKLKGYASTLLQNYQAKKGLLRAHAIPPTEQDVAQYLLTAIATGNGVAECVFNRILLLHNIGYDIIYSHRTYGDDLQQTIQQAGEWLKTNEATMEASLTTFSPVPEVNTLEQWRAVAP